VPQLCAAKVEVLVEVELYKGLLDVGLRPFL
jgi:hypothetical protein